MSNESVIYLTDRSAVETDDRCGMRYWWNRIEGGRGIVDEQEAFDLRIGRETHEDLATVATMEDISEEALKAVVADLLSPITEEDKIEQAKMELLYRRIGWFVAFALYIEPEIRRKYEDVGIEREIILDRQPLWVAVTPDRLLKDRTTGQLVYREYKTTISASNKWLESWKYAIQIHTSLAAIEEEIGTKVAYGQVMGLMKGYTTQERMFHPYAWGYYNATDDEWSSSYKQGAKWEAMPAWEYPGGPVEWVKFCGEEVAKGQFPHTAPIFLNRRMLDLWVDRRIAREEVIHTVKHTCTLDPQVRQRYFEMRTAQCRPAFGDQCPYLRACWNASIGADPLSHGYVPRTPHHDVEITLGDE